MAKNRRAVRLHLLAVRQIQAAGEGDHGDGNGLLLRVRDESCAWVFRYTSPAGADGRWAWARRAATLRRVRRQRHDARKLAHEAREQVGNAVGESRSKPMRPRRSATNATVGR
jgi:hypothetical protein